VQDVQIDAGFSQGRQETISRLEERAKSARSLAEPLATSRGWKIQGLASAAKFHELLQIGLHGQYVLPPRASMANVQYRNQEFPQKLTL